jgi:hypothetical protein
VPKFGERASTGFFAHTSVLGNAPTPHFPLDSVCFSLGYPLVIMVQPSQDRNCNHLGSHVRRGTKESIGFGNVLLNTLMRSCSIEVCHIPVEHSLELFLMEDQQMVKAFLPHTPQKRSQTAFGRFA